MAVADFLSGYSVQYWLESAPQGYLIETEYGHPLGEKEPELLLQDPLLREQSIRTTVQLVVGERCALAASSGLINAAPDEGSKRFLATQTLDEARHVEIFTQRLLDLGVKKSELEETIREHANPNLVKFAELLLEKVDKKDFVAGVVGQNIVLEGMAFHVFEMLHATSAALNPKFAHTLSGTIADERRHVGFGENRIGGLIREHPERKPDVERLQKEMSYWMLATFAEAFRQGPAQEELRRVREEAQRAGVGNAPAEWQGADLRDLEPSEMEGLLADTVLKEFKLRLERIGIEYQSPERP
jgi:rubrerythrin